MDQFRKWAQKEYSLRSRVLGTLVAGLLFVILLPLMIARLGPEFDRTISLGMPELGLWPLAAGVALMLFGGFFALWAIADQLMRARGTPLPMMATQELLVSGPFKLCRNPMSLGTILLYMGLAITIVSLGALVLVLVFSALLLTYIKRVEEKELEERFGQEYLDYKQQTPFLVPRLIR